MTPLYPLELEGRTSRLQQGWQSYTARKTRKRRSGSFVKLTFTRGNAGKVLTVEDLPPASRLIQKQATVVKYNCGLGHLHTIGGSLAPGATELIDVSGGVATAWRTTEPKAWVDWALHEPGIEPGALAHVIAVECKEALIARLDRTKLVHFLEARLIGAPISGEGQAVIDDPQLLEDSNAARSIQEDPDPSIAEILTSMTRPGASLEERLKCIHLAELLPVPHSLENLFLTQWKSFIEQNRDTRETRVLMAVACAIRKYVAVMPAANLAEIAFLLETGHAGHLSLELEVTVSKMIVRKLTANPPQADNAWPELAEQLFVLADDYLRDRQLPRQFIGAVALNASLALIMLRANSSRAVLERVRSLKTRWFVESVSDRAEEIVQEIVLRRADEQNGFTVRALREAVAFLGAQYKTGNGEYASKKA